MLAQEVRRESLVQDMEALTAENAKLSDAVQARSVEVDLLQVLVAALQSGVPLMARRAPPALFLDMSRPNRFEQQHWDFMLQKM